MKKKVTLLGIMFLIFFSSCSQQSDFPVLKGPYLGQKPPGMTPEIFAPGIVSTGAWEYGTAFSKDGKEFYYAIAGVPYNVIVAMKEVNGIWTKPKIASFSGMYDEHDMLFSADGKKLYYTSKRPLKSGDNPEKENSIWVVTKKEDGWSEPEKLGPPINSAGSENYSSLSLKGTMVFHRYEQPTDEINSDIFVSRLMNGKYEEPKRLGPEINSKYDEWDPFIAPDESYLIFSSVRRPDGIGVVDMYICFRLEDGSWTKARNMGEPFNSSGSENCAAVSLDGKYLFFCSTRRSYKRYSETPITLSQKISIMNSYGNGQADIYWVDAKIIETLKPDKLK